MDIARVVAIAACSGAIALAATGCGGSDDKPGKTTAKPQLTAAQRARQARLVKGGKRLFLKNCTYCHSMLGRHHTGPIIEGIEAPDFDEVRVKDEAYIHERLASGGFDMPGFQGQLSERQFKAIIAFISTTTGRNVDDAAADATPSDELAMGEQVFRSKCQSCHAIEGRPVTGKPDYVGMDFDLMKPSQRYVRRQIVKGRPEEMPSFAKQLSDEQIAAVAAYVTSVSGETRRRAGRRAS